MKSCRFHPILIALLVATWATAAHAQTFGRVVIFAKTPDGNPLEGVKVTATNAETNFKFEAMTNKKGKATISVVDATKVYSFHFEYSGIRPFDAEIKPVVGSSVTREITIDLSAGGSQVAPAEGEEAKFTPSELAYNSGVEAMKSGDRALAKTKFAEALEKNPKLGAAYAALAQVNLADRDFAAALSAAQRYQELEPGTTRGYYLVYEAQRGLGNKEAADQALAAMSKLSSGDTAAMFYNEGVEAMKLGDRVSAKSRFLEALNLDPNLTHAMRGVVIVLIEDKSYAEAVAMAERLLARDPKDKTAMRARWDGYKGLGDKAKEDEAFAVLAAADPKTLADELCRVGNELFNGGDINGALEKFTRCLEADANRPKAHYQLGLCYANREETAKAKEHLAQFIAMAPEDPDAAAAKEMMSYLK